MNHISSNGFFLTAGPSSSTSSPAPQIDSFSNLVFTSEKKIQKKLIKSAAANQITSLLIHLLNRESQGNHLWLRQKVIQRIQLLTDKLIPEQVSVISSLILSIHDDLNYPETFPSHIFSLEIDNCPSLTCLKNLPEYLIDLTLRNNDNLRIISAFPKNLKALYLSRCKNLIFLPDIPVDLTDLSISRCKILSFIADIPQKLRYFKLSKCRELPQEVRRSILETLINTNFELAKKVIWTLEIEDTSDYEEKIAEDDLPYYLDNLLNFYPPNQEVRLRILEELINHDPSGVQIYASSFCIEDTVVLNNLLMKDENLKEIINQYQQHLTEDMDLSFMIPMLIAVEDNNYLMVEFLLTLPHAAKQMLKIKDRPDVRDFIIRHFNLFLEEENCRDALCEIYPPDQEANAMLYPLITTICLLLNKFEIDSTLKFPYENAVIALAQLGAEIENIILPKQLDIYFYGQYGVDRGGLGRQYISSLFSGLIHSSNVCFTRRDNGQYLPTLRLQMNISSEEVKIFNSLGRTFAFLLNSDPEYPIGELFDLQFFQKLVAITEEQIVMSPLEYQNYLSQLDKASFLTLCASLIEREKDFLDMKSLLEAENVQCLSTELINLIENSLFIKINEANFETSITEYFEDVKTLYFSYLVAVHAIARGINKCLPFQLQLQETNDICDDWSTFRQTTPTTLYHRLQGTVTKEEFLNSISVFSLDEEKQNEVQAWVNEWVEGVDLNQIRRWLIILTGAPSISEEITISISDQNDGFNYATCFNTLNLSSFIDKETFFRELNLSTRFLDEEGAETHANYTFNTA